MSNCLRRDCKHASDEKYNCKECMYECRPYADNTVILYDLYEPKKVFCPICGIIENEPKFMQKYCRYCGHELIEEEKYTKGDKNV